MNAPTAFLRIVFAISAFTTSYFPMLSALPSATRDTAHGVYIAAIVSTLTSALLCYQFIRVGRLTTPRVELATLIKSFAKSLAVSYVKLAFLVGLVFLASLSAVGLPVKEAALFAGFAALWLPLWLSPAVAALSTPRRLGVKAENGD